MPEDTPPSPPRFRTGLYPHSGWVVPLPDGMTLTGGTREELELKLARHLGLTPEAAKDFVDASLCVRYPSSCSGGRTLRRPVLGIADRAAFYISSFEGRVPPAPIPPEEVSRRLETCKKCPSNGGLTAPGCCGNKRAIEATTRAVADKYKVPAPFGAGWCSMTGYNIAIAAHLTPSGSITPEDPAHDSLPPHCHFASHP